MVVMITIKFPYAEIEPISVQEKNFAGLYEPPIFKQVERPEKIIRNSLAVPYTYELRKQLCKTAKILILVDDITRPTRTDVILPQVLAVLAEEGVPEHNIRFLIALGTHRPMNSKEMEYKFGDAVMDRFEIFNHDWKNPTALADLGCTKNGIDIEINRLIQDADIVIGIGHIAPHANAGFSGGGKILLPGACGQNTVMQLHNLARSIMVNQGSLRGKIDNPVRELINSVAIKAGLDYVVNVVQDRSRRIVECYCGHPLAAFRAGALKAKDIYSTFVPGPFDIVVTDSAPADIDLWQAGKGIESASLIVPKGGVIILVSPCHDGVSKAHPILLELSQIDSAAIQELIDKDKVNDKVGAAALIGHKWLASRYHIIMVSPGITESQKRRLGLDHADTANAALKKALAICGAQASVGILRHGGEILPICL